MLLPHEQLYILDYVASSRQESKSDALNSFNIIS